MRVTESVRYRGKQTQEVRERDRDRGRQKDRRDRGREGKRDCENNRERGNDK